MIAKEIYSIGYTLLEGQSWKNNRDPFNSKKNGEYTVVSFDINKSEKIVALLNFQNLKLNGKAVFFDNNREERFIYKDDMIDGWGVVLDSSIETTKLFYENGVLKRKLINENLRNGYWKEIDVFSNQVIGYFLLDECNKRTGIGYSYKNGMIEGVYEYKEDEKVLCYKSMNEGVMKEYTKEGEVVYEGYFKNNFEEDFPRSEEKDESCVISVSYPISRIHIWKEFFPEDCTIDVLIVNNKKEGKGRVYSTFGIPLGDLNFVDNELDGICKFYNEFGELEKELCFEKGTRQGWFCYHTPNGESKMGLHENDKEVSSLRQYSKDTSFLEEIVDGKVISICKYNDNHKRHGLCGIFCNDKLQSVIRYDNGDEKELVYEFNDNIMFEYENNKIVYCGEFTGDISTGFFRKEKSHINQNYQDDHQIDYMTYDSRNNSNMQDGLSNSSELSFNLGHTPEKEELSGNMDFRIKGEIMVEYKDKQIVYVGEYSKDYSRCGKGRTISYDGMNVKEVVEWNNNSIIRKTIFEKNKMIEYRDDGGIDYKGDYKGDVENGFFRDGSGYEYDNKGDLQYMGNWINGEREGEGSYYKNEVLKYSGNWKNGKPDGVGSWWDGHQPKYEGEWYEGKFEISKGMWFDYYTENINEVKKEKREYWMIMLCLLGIMILCIILLLCFGLSFFRINDTYYNIWFGKLILSGSNSDIKVMEISNDQRIKSIIVKSNSMQDVRELHISGKE